MNSLGWPWGLMLVTSERSSSGPLWARPTFSIGGLWGKLLQGKQPQSQPANPTGSKPRCFQQPRHPRSDTSFSVPPCHGCRPPPQPQRTASSPCPQEEKPQAVRGVIELKFSLKAKNEPIWNSEQKSYPELVSMQQITATCTHSDFHMNYQHWKDQLPPSFGVGIVLRCSSREEPKLVVRSSYTSIPLQFVVVNECKFSN